MILRKDLDAYKEKKLEEIQELENKRDQEIADVREKYDHEIDTVRGKIAAVDELIKEHGDDIPEGPGELE